MERISEEDVDCFLQQMKRLSEADSAIDMRQEERRHFQDFCIWIPEVFRQTEIENAEEIFWSERLPDVVFLNEDKTAGITLQKFEDARTRVSMTGSDRCWRSLMTDLFFMIQAWRQTG